MSLIWLLSLDAIGPRIVIPMHFKTPKINLNIAPLEEFLAAMENDPDRTPRREPRSRSREHRCRQVERSSCSNTPDDPFCVKIERNRSQCRAAVVQCRIDLFARVPVLQESTMSDPNSIRLTQFAKRAGCAAKQPPDYLLSVLAALPPIVDPNVLVGHATSDDAAVYRLSDDLALDLDDGFLHSGCGPAYDFGAVAAANALATFMRWVEPHSTALSLVGFPNGALPPEVLAEILRGAAEKAQEAGIAIVGGHTIQTDEPIFGLAVVGRASPRLSSRMRRATGRLPDSDQAAGIGDHHDCRQAKRG